MSQQFLITAPDGTKYQVTGPDGATEQDALAQVQAQHTSGPRSFDVGANGELVPSNSPQAKENISPVAGNSFLENARAGFGKAFVDLGRGAGQLVGAVSRQDVANSRERDAPLMKTGGGITGNIAGNVAATLPTLAIPGANTVTGAGLIGAGLGLLQPSTSTKETLLNTGVGAVAGAGGQWLGNRLANAADARLAARETAAQTEQGLNAARDTVLQQSREAGYVVAPTAVNPTMTNTALESVSGKAATRQAAEAINARVTNRLIAEDLGLAPSQPITREALAGVRNVAARAYQPVRQAGTFTADGQYINEIAALTQAGADLERAAPGIGAQANQHVQQLADSLLQESFDSNSAVNLFRFLNDRARASFKAAFVPGGNSQALELARAQRAAADAVGGLIERNLASQGNAELATQWQQARTLIAQSHMAEAALRGNNVDALRLAAQFRKGSPLTGGFRAAAEFADQFGEFARLPKSGVGASRLAATVGGGGALTALATGHPVVAAGAVVGTAAPYAIRRGMLSAAGQNLLATPAYAPGLLGTAGLNALGTAGRYGALPAYRGVSSLVQPPQ